MNSYEAMAGRYSNAEDRFLACVRDISGCTSSQAAKVLDYYRKHKLVSLSYIDGQFKIKSGVFLEPDVIQRTIKL